MSKFDLVCRQQHLCLYSHPSSRYLSLSVNILVSKRPLHTHRSLPSIFVIECVLSYLTTEVADAVSTLCACQVDFKAVTEVDHRRQQGWRDGHLQLRAVQLA